MQGDKSAETETKTFYDSGSSRVESPVVTPVTAPSATPSATPPTKETETEEPYDFSTEKIAVNLDLHGESSKTTKKKDGNESEDEIVMSATAYPGQAWDPSYYGWN